MATYNPLSTNFKDDILADSNDRRKYTQINNSDGTISLQDSTAYKQVGSQYGAKEVNEEREAINNIYANKLVSLDEIDLVTEEGYFVDAKAVKELNSKIPDVYYEEVSLHYYDGAYMTATVNVGKQFAGRPVQVTSIYKSGYPTKQTWNVSATPVDSNGSTTIWAYGSNYVSAHVMNVLVRCETDPT